MTKANLVVGMMVVTENGKARLVMPTKNDGLVLVSEDSKFLKVDKLNDDLTRGRYKAGNDVVAVYDIMDDVNSSLFTVDGRDLVFDRNQNFDTSDMDDNDCDCDDCEDCYEDEEDWDEDWDEDVTTTSTTEFSKADVTPGMLAVTRDGQNRLAVPTADMGLVLAARDSKFIRMDKLNDDLTIRDYNKDGKNVDKVYSLANGVTTDFYSTEGRQLLFDRDGE